jgi:hypothetical protein
MRRFGVRLQLLVVALVVLLAAVASARSHYFCKMMGQAVAECCCPGAHEASASAAARAPDCCEVIAASKPAVAVSHQATTVQFSEAGLAVMLPAFEYPQPSFRLLQTPALLARPPPALGPPLFISNCALLI